MNKKLILEIGTKFGKWKIVSEQTIKLNNLTHWKCKCDCGIEQYVPLNNLMNGSSSQCRSCSLKESGIKRRKGCGGISGEMWSQLKSNVLKKGHNFDLRIEEAWNRFKYQKGKCALTNQDITLTGYPYNKKKTTAVLTLINEDQGYKLNNVIWIHKRIAKMKSEMSLDEFLELTYNITVNGEKLVENIDYYLDENGNFIFTEKYHLDRGRCCKSINGCKHCPYPEEERKRRALP